MTLDADERENLPEQESDRLKKNISKIEVLAGRLTAALAAREPVPAALQGPGQDLFMKAASSCMTDMVNDPAKLFEQQVSYWGEALENYTQMQSAWSKAASGEPAMSSAPEAPQDRRFSNPLWDTNPYFKFVKQQYLTNADSFAASVQNISGLAEGDHERVSYFTKQIVDMMSPTNFLATNPDALEAAVKTDGESLVRGLENLVRDLEEHQGQMVVGLADKTAFKLGKDLATTPGKVVFRNRLFELIQYAPSTPTVHKTPLLIFPPWINKFYILDLKEKNSLIKWAVDQGFTLFVVSWINPDESFSDVGMDDYVQEGFLAAIEQVKAITGEEKINVTGYCIAGTTLSLALGVMKERGDESVNSATFFTTLTDFSDQGEVGVFLDDDFIDGIAVEATRKGIMQSLYMSRTFSYLRANDLIYQPAIRSYMLGEAPPAFDLLFWNEDGTNLPAKMAIEYLRGLCQNDLLATTGFPICGTKIQLSDVTVPVCAIGCETDHIAKWEASYNGVKKMGSTDKTFILSQSGHIAGIVNPPSKKKYGHYVNADVGLPSHEWKAQAEFASGSWWPRWGAWLAERSGGQVDARALTDSDNAGLGDAPGTYVLRSSKC
jgi:polyhydroxyalkanoate synthase